MKKIRFLLEIFSMVTTCVVIAVAFFVTVLDPADVVESYLLWQIPAVSFLCALGCLIYPWDRTVGKKEMRIRTLVHYLQVNVIVMAAGYWFHWYNIRQPGSVLTMLFTIGLIFIIVSVVSWTRDAGEAKRMNQRLREYQQKKETEKENP